MVATLTTEVRQGNSAPGGDGSLGRRRRRLPRPGPRLAIGACSVGLFLLLWELNRHTEWISPELIASPSIILEALPGVLKDDLLAKHLPATVTAIVTGFIPAVVVGVLVGCVVGLSKRLTYLLEPLIMVFYITPRVALIPLFIIWLGIGLQSKVAMVFISAVFPVLMNTVAGVKGIERVWVRAARGFGASSRQTIFKAVLPGAIPSIMTGIRLGWGRAVMAVVVAEMYVSVAGLGKLIRTYQNSVSTDSLFVVIVLITIIGYLGIQIIALIERRVSPWAKGLKW